jgi:predicted GNAT family N-acyltransferase
MRTIVVTNQQELEQGLEIRKEVFVKEQGVNEELEVDEYDASPEACVHFLLLDADGKAIGAARMKPYEQGSAKMQRIAIRQSSRGLGYGRALLQAMEVQAAADGYLHSVLDAQVQAEPFYAKQGYVTISEQTFYDAGIEHVRMRKKLS